MITGGASNVTDVVELAESVFRMPVRLGAPHNIAGLLDVRDNPSYATGVGLLMHGLSMRNTPTNFNVSSGRGLWSRMRDWFSGNF